MKVFTIGIGLIGGSFSLDIKENYPYSIIYGIDKNKDHLKKAISLGLVDKKGSLKNIEIADVIIIAIPVDMQIELLPKILNKINNNAIVFDVGSTKELVCKSINTHAKRRNFLATHPIAGLEFSGPEAAIRGLFKNKTNIICEIEKTAFKLQEKALDIFNKLGMRIRYMDPKSHDKHIAYVSHLSHISSFMLGKTVMEKKKNECDIFDMAGSGFESTVRLAKSSPDMWTPIFKQNKTNILETLQSYIENLQKFEFFLKQDDYKSIYTEIKKTNYIKQILNGIN